MYHSLAWNSVCSQEWLWTTAFPVSASVGIIGICYCTWFFLKLFSLQSIKTQKHLGASTSFCRKNSAVQEEHLVGAPAISEGTGCFQFSAKLLWDQKKFISSLSRVSVGYEEPRAHCFTSSSTPWVQWKACGIPHSGMKLYMQNTHMLRIYGLNYEFFL